VWLTFSHVRLQLSVESVRSSTWFLRSIGAFQSDTATVGSEADVLSNTLKSETYTPQRFTSQENYFPVFESNSRDLQVLEASVVTNVTAFYTYMKVLRDYLRRVADLTPATSNKKGQMEWRETWCNIIYMQFLAYETARKSVDDLIEYEPTHVENTVTILLTEVPAYRFLLDTFREDFRYGRLRLRYPDYERVANELRSKINNRDDNPEWDKAIELWPELRRRYETSLNVDIGEPVRAKSRDQDLGSMRS
jgi:hypothetical protein